MESMGKPHSRRSIEHGLHCLGGKFDHRGNLCESNRWKKRTELPPICVDRGVQGRVTGLRAGEPWGAARRYWGGHAAGSSKAAAACSGQ